MASSWVTSDCVRSVHGAVEMEPTPILGLVDIRTLSVNGLSHVVQITLHEFAL